MLPGAFPKSPEEIAAAAKKYNIRVEDYKPIADNGEGYVFKSQTCLHWPSIIGFGL